MAAMKLYDKPECPFCWKIRLALSELDIDVEIFDSQSIDYIDEWRAMSPRNTVPVLVKNNMAIYESNVILEYLHDISGSLLPNNPDERVMPRLINQYSDSVIGAGLREVIFEKRDKAEYEWDLERIQKGVEKFEQALEYLSEQLGSEIFFGSSYSLSECALTARFGLAEAYGIAIPTRFANLINWFSRMKSRPSYQNTAPQICLENK